MRRIVAPNGLRIVAERMPHRRGIALGVFVKGGTSVETPHQAGMAHLLEHMLFKGTSRRSAQQIAQEIDRMGGSLDGVTSREYTAYYARAHHKFFAPLLDILADLIGDSRLPEDELERERNVILEEIAMYEDSPEDLIHDLWAQSLWGMHPLGWPVLGTRESVAAATAEDLKKFYRTHYQPREIIVSFAGDMNLDEVKDALLEAFKFFRRGEESRTVLPTPRPRIENVHHERDLEQIHFCLGGVGLPYKDERRYDLLALNTLLGGTASSRLFQEVREKRGLVYSIYSYFSCYRETGYFSVSGGTTPENADEVYSIVNREIDRLMQEPVSQEDVDRVREQLKGNFLLECDHVEYRMMQLAKMELFEQPLISVDETLKRLDGISAEGIQALAKELFDSAGRMLVSLGPGPESEGLADSEGELLSAQIPLLDR